VKLYLDGMIDQWLAPLNPLRQLLGITPTSP
jgi:hypothetical protein